MTSVERLKEMCRSAVCPNCWNKHLRHCASQSRGHDVCKTMSSSRVDSTGTITNRGTFEIHNRSVAAFNTMGTGFAGYRTFSMLTNTPAMSERAYILCSNNVSKATSDAGEDKLQEAVNIVRNVHLDLDPSLEF